jgi:hypothetical protein
MIMTIMTMTITMSIINTNKPQGTPTPRFRSIRPSLQTSSFRQIRRFLYRVSSVANVPPKRFKAPNFAMHVDRRLNWFKIAPVVVLSYRSMRFFAPNAAIKTDN